jgi:hypothetical protein
MERNSQVEQGFILESQIREAYGKVVYSQTCQDKKYHSLIQMNDRVKMAQIVLSALTTGGFIAAVALDEMIAGIVGALFSTMLLILNAYMKNFEPIAKADKHKEASDILWKIKEEYVSLLTDFETLSQDDIKSKRDNLQARVHEVYTKYPKTDLKSYLEAQKALKTEEEQTFSEQEIDVMLPNSIRRNNRHIDS